MTHNTQQAVNPQPVNFMSALFDAVNIAIAAGQNYQLAVGISTENAVKIEDNVYNSWKFSLTPSNQFSAKMTKYQSWMTVSKLKTMEQNELAREATEPSKELNWAALNASGVHLSTSAGVKAAFSKMVRAAVTSAFAPSYLNHHLSKATLAELAEKVATAPKDDLTKWNTLYGQAQTGQRQQTQEADANVQAEQSQLTQISSNNQQKAMLVSSINSLMSLVANGSIQ